jgi:hypothetical protein
LLAFGELRSVFHRNELGQIFNTMAERGVRIRASHALDDYLIEKEGADELGSDEDVEDWGEEIIEAESQSLQRLRPY